MDGSFRQDVVDEGEGERVKVREERKEERPRGMQDTGRSLVSESLTWQQ